MKLKDGRVENKFNFTLDGDGDGDGDCDDDGDYDGGKIILHWWYYPHILRGKVVSQWETPMSFNLHFWNIERQNFKQFKNSKILKHSIFLPNPL